MSKQFINVTLVSPYPPPMGGIASWAIRYLEKAESFNIKCSHVSTAFKGQIVFGDNTKISLFKQYKRSRRIWRDVKKSIETNSSKVIHICIPCSFTSMLREYKTISIAKKRCLKTIIHFRSDVSKCINGKLSTFLFKKITKKVDGLILLNKQSYDFSLKFTNKSKCIIIPNFIDDKDIASSHEINNELKDFIYVGGVVEDKGCNLILSIAKKHPEYNFKLIGNPSNVLEKEFTKLNNVELLYEQPKDVVEALLAKSDVFLFLSKYVKEGFSNAVIEAMCKGLPCIVTKWASNEYQIGDYSNKLSIDVDNFDQLENAISFLRDSNIRKTISMYNINRSKMFAASNIMNQYYDFYCRLLGK